MPKRPDVNQLAASIVAKTTQPDTPDAKSLLDDAALRNSIMREMGSRGGLKGGKARAENLSAKRRQAIAKKAAAARWKKKAPN
jgi:hypothetical protein